MVSKSTRFGITGASGFVGSHLKSTLDKQYSVTQFKRKRGETLPDIDRLQEFARKTDVVFHLAGVNRGTDEEITTGNILWTYRLVQALKSVKPSPRVIFASSSQVYRPTNRPLKERDKPKPESLYGFAKLSAEEILLASGLDCIILRLSNVYGPGCRPNYNSVIATFCQRAINQKPLTINGDGSQGRDFVYVDDIVRAFLLSVNIKSRTRIFNVSSGKIISLRTILNQINNRSSELQVEYNKNADMGGLSYCCDFSRFKKQCGWASKVSLKKGINNTLDFFKNATN
jgi:nucleoside-diphosphate-sugar epimerase